MTAHVEQPMPTPNDHPSIQSRVRTDLEHREQVGIQRYGSPLQPFNGRDALRDLYEELLDGACYARQAMEERDERQRHPVRYVIGVREDGVTEIQPVAADVELAAERDRLAAELETARAYLNAQGDEDVPDAHKKLWSILDWAFWGHGVRDTLRERAAAMMVLALPTDLRAELLKIFAAWKEHRGALPLEPYEELRDRTLAAEKARSELANRLAAAERERDRLAGDLERVTAQRDEARARLDGLDAVVAWRLSATHPFTPQEIALAEAVDGLLAATDAKPEADRG